MQGGDGSLLKMHSSKGWGCVPWHNVCLVSLML